MRNLPAAGRYENGAAPAAPTREYIYSGAALLAKIESGATTYYHSDQLSVRMITDSTGSVLGQQAHYPFGESWYQNSTTTKWLFTSYERDAESGNAHSASRMGLRDDYAMGRYNVNRLGRFASPDPLAGAVADPQSLNRYAGVYPEPAAAGRSAANNPADSTDPLGLSSVYRGSGGELRSTQPIREIVDFFQS